MKIDMSTVWWIMSFSISIVLIWSSIVGLALFANMSETAKMYDVRGEWAAGLVVMGMIASCILLMLVFIIYTIASRDEAEANANARAKSEKNK